eukprot:CAMPEP_0185296868 /NCGR_PEP_ID=MMETSP1363-20130426/9405_1 /TAXON_ID=38817 /ORGANISM="Gephyrocapsa oceanica, Strain RCC1303" /LENGTH=821 /DNA_ID=CAMNT_0027893571 /DNA_START=20 /DNA_END=2483 /DNA_ORIENTATION=-
MTTQDAHDEWVDVAASLPAAAQPAAARPVDAATDPLIAYRNFVSNDTHPAPIFKAGGVCFVLRYGRSCAADVTRVARSNYDCNACCSRASNYVRDLGPDGPVFLYSLKTVSAPDDCISRIRDLAVKTCAQPNAKPELVVVTPTTYAPVAEGCMPCGEPFLHWTVFPAEVTLPEAAERYDMLKNYYGMMDSRLAKLTAPEAVASVQIMLEEQPALERPDHYASVLRWVGGLQQSALDGGGSFDAMTEPDKAKLRVVAIMSGRVDGQTHLDFHQADNVVDFLTMPSRDALRAEMDRRSDPQYYMVSQLNRRLASAGVTSDHLIGLTWDGQYADDLDLHVTTPNGKKIYYGCKSADGCKLDFDANVSKGEAHPCENISCRPGRFTVRVDNFTRRTFGVPIPFQVVCRQTGMADVVYDCVWPPNRQKGVMIDVCKHVFTEVQQPNTAMSANSASRAKALDGEWTSAIGQPSATIATASALEGVEGVELITCGAPAATKKQSDSEQVGRVFMDMALNAHATAGGKKKKSYLSESCREQPKTTTELKAYMRAHPSAAVTIQMRDHSPGYLVTIGTKTAGVRKTNTPAPCHFREKHAYPVKPVRGAVGNARLDSSWLASSERGGMARVRALVDVSGSCTFLALQGAKLPPQQGEAFPLASGFYPTDLSTDFHAHRERWGFFHTQLKPSMPPSGAAVVPMVGAFLAGETAVVFIDGVKMTLEVSEQELCSLPTAASWLQRAGSMARLQRAGSRERLQRRREQGETASVTERVAATSHLTLVRRRARARGGRSQGRGLGGSSARPAAQYPAAQETEAGTELGVGGLLREL